MDVGDYGGLCGAPGADKGIKSRPGKRRRAKVSGERKKDILDF